MLSYDLDRSIDDIRLSDGFAMICHASLPEGVICTLELSSFEEDVRNAVSLGGDSDSPAAMAAPVAEALHRIPRWIVRGARATCGEDGARS